MLASTKHDTCLQRVLTKVIGPLVPNLVFIPSSYFRDSGVAVFELLVNLIT